MTIIIDLQLNVVVILLHTVFIGYYCIVTISQYYIVDNLVFIVPFYLLLLCEVR